MTKRIFTFQVAAPAATYLAQQSAALAAGQWSSALWPTSPATYGWNSPVAIDGTSVLQDDPGTSSTQISYAGCGGYAPNFGVCFIGGGVGSISNPLNSWITRYNETANFWSKRRDPSNLGTSAGGSGHQYYCSAVNPKAGVSYRLKTGTGSSVTLNFLWRFTTATGALIAIHAKPAPFTMSSTPGSVACAEDWGTAGQCFVFSGPDGSFAVWDEATQAWVYAFDGPAIAGTANHSFACYHKGTNVVLHGGGSSSMGVYKMDSTFNRTPLADAPYSINGTSNGGKILDLGHPTKVWVIFHAQPGAPVYTLDLVANGGAGVWTQTLDVVPAKALAVLANTFAVALRQYGTVLWMFNRAGSPANFTGSDPDLREEVAYLFKPLSQP